MEQAVSVDWKQVVKRLPVFSISEKHQIIANVEIEGLVQDVQEEIIGVDGDGDKLVDVFRWHVYPTGDPAVPRFLDELRERMAKDSALRSSTQQRSGSASLQLRSIRGYSIEDQFLEMPLDAKCMSFWVDVRGVALHTKTSLVLQSVWKGEVWWLKFGPDVTERQKALQGLEQEWAWERWFQTERDMFFRAQLGDMDAFPVAAMSHNRSAMLVKDAGVTLEKFLFTSAMTPWQVYDMSKQVFKVLQSCACKGVYHGDISLQNICYKDGVFSLIDWGLACGSKFLEFAQVIHKAWPSLGVSSIMPGIPNWELSSNCYFLGMRPQDGSCDLESLVYCCLKILNGNSLPWSTAAESGTEVAVLHLRRQHMPSLVARHKGHLYEPLVEQLNWSLITCENITGL